MASCDAARCSASCLAKEISGTNNTSSAEISSRSPCLMSSQCDEKAAAAASTVVSLPAALLAVASSITFGWLVRADSDDGCAWW